MQIELTLHQGRDLSLAIAKTMRFLQQSPNTANLIGIDNQQIARLVKINEKIAAQVATATEEYYPNTVATHSLRQ